MELIPRASPNRAMPIGSPMAITDPNATNRITTAAARPINSAVPCPLSSKLKNRSPLASTWSAEPSRASATASLSSSRSATPSSCSTGYCTCRTTTSPSAETDPLSTAASGPAPSAPAGSFVASTLVRSPTSACTSATAACSASDSKKDVPSSSGVITTRAVRPARSDPAASNSSVASAESSPGTSKLSSRSRPNALDATTTTMAATAHIPITIHGRRAASRPNRKSADDMRSSLRGRRAPTGAPS